MKPAHCTRRPARRENPLRSLDMHLLGLIIVFILFGSAGDLKGGGNIVSARNFSVCFFYCCGTACTWMSGYPANEGKSNEQFWSKQPASGHHELDRACAGCGTWRGGLRCGTGGRAGSAQAAPVPAWKRVLRWAVGRARTERSAFCIEVVVPEHRKSYPNLGEIRTRGFPHGVSSSRCKVRFLSGPEPSSHPSRRWDGRLAPHKPRQERGRVARAAGG